LIELQIVGSGVGLTELLPTYGWRVLQTDPGHSQPRHPTPVLGATIILGGRMDIGVGGGELKKVALLPGDMLMFLDAHGEGHSTAIVGPDPLRMFGVSFTAADWPVVREHFSGWPDDLQVLD
jgi:hypothetical protein